MSGLADNVLAERFMELCRAHMIDAVRNEVEHRGLTLNAQAAQALVDAREPDLTWARFLALLEAFDQPGGVEAIGLLIGRRFTMSDFGVLGYVAMAARTFGESVELTRPFTRLLGWDITVRVVRSVEGFVDVEIEDAVKLPRALQEFWATVCLTGIVKKMPDADLGLVDAGFTHVRPDYWDRFFGMSGRARGRFETGRCYWRYPAEWSDLPLSSSDDELRVLCLAKLARIGAAPAPETDIIVRLRDFIAENSSEGFPGMETAASSLNLSVQTLRRRLKDRGITYKQLIADQRMDLAVALLTSGQMRASEVAYRVGYGAPANFYTAFKKRHGFTTRSLRALGPGVVDG